MAAIERGEGEDDAVVRGWLTRALSASRGPQWICDKCHEVNTVWQPTCEHCGGFDTLSWREARAGGGARTTDILPLVVRPGLKDRPAAREEPVSRSVPSEDGEAAAHEEPLNPPPATAPEAGNEPRGAVYDAEFIDGSVVRN
jgi:HemY protein